MYFSVSDKANTTGLPNFTGAFVRMACQYLAGTLQPADFDFFKFSEGACVRIHLLYQNKALRDWS